MMQFKDILIHLHVEIIFQHINKYLNQIFMLNYQLDHKTIFMQNIRFIFHRILFEHYNVLLNNYN